jgi:tuberculosinol/isotuberculosinol synthase
MDLETFLNLSTDEVARIVRAEGPKVCVFPINGTRRWFMLEYTQSQGENLVSNYLDVAGKRHLELYQLFFDLNIKTLLTPVFGPDLLDRGESYVQSIGAEGLERLATHSTFLDFYESYDVRVRFYGDYRKALENTSFSYLSGLFDKVTAKTRAHNTYRLFFGVFAHDATESVAELAIKYYTEHKDIPSKQDLVKLYYGEYVPSVDLFIGFDKFSVFDMPLVTTGNEDLYFTVAPSPYLTESQLRVILYDHLYVRPEDESSYSELTSVDWNAMRNFYRANFGKTQGVGARSEKGKFWYPLPQVTVPECLT